MIDLYSIINEDKLKYSLYVEDLKTNEIIFDINSDEEVTSASMIKIFIMAEAYSQISKDEFMSQKTVNIDRDNIVGGSLIKNLSNYCYSIKDLIFLMMNLSDNTATNQLIDILRIENINKFINEEGLKNTVINRKMMDFERKKQGFDNITSARDIAHILKKIYYKDLIDINSSVSMMNIMKKQMDNRMMARNIDKSNAKIYHKTGNIPYTNHDAGIVIFKDIEYLFVMLTWDGIDNIYGRKVIGEVSEKIYNDFLKNYGY